MDIQIAGGERENGIVIGNTFDKYSSRNPIVKWMMRAFHKALNDLVARAAPNSIHELGCGEGYWVCKWSREGRIVRGSDFSPVVIDLARANAEAQGLAADLFKVGSIYNLKPEKDSADLLVCCEVFEHLENPHLGLQALVRTVRNFVILSVPREPIWRFLNVARGRYLRDFGNTPGHIQHWSKSAFIRMVKHYFYVIEIRSPLPWTMLLCRPKQ
jgi:2-polyprenyl-3-methyl-5-hydroxy-6-metoxy-1,4-benzoquinol methylase